MELEVGMYVRTKKGYIYKLSRYKEEEKRWICVEEDDWYPVYESGVIKASNNIIDLIEEGDYVNGERVGYIDNCEGAMREYYYDYEDVAKDCGHWFEEIKSIVTKEQFESMSYKVERKEN